jgi:hypothetical protein
MSLILLENWMAFSVAAIGQKALSVPAEHELNLAVQC